MCKESLKSLILRKFSKRQSEHAVNNDEQGSDFHCSRCSRPVNNENLPNSLRGPLDGTRKRHAQEDANRLLAELDLSNVWERYYIGNADSPARPSTADKKPPGRQMQEVPAHRTASISLPADNRSPGEPPTHGGPQGDRLKELLLPFQAWPVALTLDAAGQIQVRASRLLLPQMQEYCERHGPELQAFLESCPGHTWSTMKTQTR